MYNSLSTEKQKNRKTEKQAGAELCQAQINFQLAMKPSRIWDSNEVMIVNSFVTPTTQKESGAVSEPGMLGQF